MSQDEDVACCSLEENYKGSVFVREAEWYGMYVWYGEGGKEGRQGQGCKVQAELREQDCLPSDHIPLLYTSVLGGM
jgi:hypothetical protein